MNNLDRASRCMSAAFQAKRIGTPVSVRIVACSAANTEEVKRLLGQALGLAGDWLRAEVRRVTALGDFESGQVTVLVDFKQGQTAIISVGTRTGDQSLLEVVVVGNRGILSWEAGREDEWDPEPSAPPVSDHVRPLLNAVRRSLDAHKPITLAGIPPEAEDAGGADSPSPSARNEPFEPIRTKPPYGVLLVAGAHTHQENYAESLADDSRCRLIGVTDEPDVSLRRESLNEALATRLGIPLLADLDAALARDDVHVVSVCAEPERRAKLMVRCAEAGKHLYLDKPMTASVEQAEMVAAAVRKAGVVSQMFSQVRSPAAARLRRLVDSGSLGQLKAIHFDLTFAKGPAGSVSIDKPRVERPVPRSFELIDSKRELYNVGVYSLVLLDWLLGRRVKRVFASTANYFFAEHRRNDMEDYAVVLMELEGGITASLTAGRTGWRSHPMGGLNRTCLVGSRGVASINAYRPRCQVWADENPWLPPRLHPRDPMGFWKSTYEEADGTDKQAWLTPSLPIKDEMAYFLDCIEQGRQSDVSADVGQTVMKVLMAAYRSAAVGDFVVPRE